MFNSLRNKIFFINIFIFISIMSIMTYVIIDLFQEEKKRYIYDLNISSAIHIADEIKIDIFKDYEDISSAYYILGVEEDGSKDDRDISQISSVSSSIIALFVNEGENLVFRGYNKEKLHGFNLAIEDIYTRLTEYTPKISELTDENLLIRNASIKKGIPAYLIYLRDKADSNKIITGMVIMDTILKRIEGGGGFETAIVDMHGRIFAHRDIKKIIDNEDVSGNPIVNRFLKDATYAGTGDFIGEDGKEIIGAYSMIEGTNLYVVVTSHREVLYKVFKDAKFRIGGTAFSLAVIAFIAFAIFSKKLTLPLERLTLWAAKIEGGGLNIASGIVSKDEIGRLSTTLEKMTLELKKREEHAKDMYDKLIQSEQEATSYLEGHKIHSSLNLDEVFIVTTRIAKEKTDAEAGFLFKYDKDQGVFHHPIVYGIDAAAMKEMIIKCGILEMELDLIKVLREQFKVKDYLIVPLKTIDVMHGVLLVINHQSGGFTEHHKNILLLFASQASIAIEKVKLFEQSEYLATHDPLTGVLNRNFFNRIEYKKIDQTRDVSYILLDIDYFKKINDTYGHTIGDIVLKEMGAILKKHIRDNDMAVRYGGEEFLIILHESTKSSASQFAERIRVFVEGYKFFIDTDKWINVTVSMGVCVLSEMQHKEGGDKISPVESADIALYKAKSCGRNRVEVFG